jgi:uroporphyrinogen-III synthase
MDDIVARLAGEGVGHARVALQLFDPAAHPSTDALRALAASLIEVPVYRWRLPDDDGPARELIGATADGSLAAVTFTSQPAVHHMFRIAETVDRADAVRAALNGPVLAACIGPVCAEAATEEGLTATVWPEPSRLPAMVRLVTDVLGAGAA